MRLINGLFAPHPFQLLLQALPTQRASSSPWDKAPNLESRHWLFPAMVLIGFVSQALCSHPLPSPTEATVFLSLSVEPTFMTGHAPLVSAFQPMARTGHFI